MPKEESGGLPPGRRLAEPRSTEQQSSGHSSSEKVSPIPRVVCDALNLLEIKQEPPFWKIIDNRGRITLVLHWEQSRNNRLRYMEPYHCCHSRQPAAAPLSSGIASGSVPAPTHCHRPECKIKSMTAPSSEDIVTIMSEGGVTVTTVRSKHHIAESGGNKVPQLAHSLKNLPSSKHANGGSSFGAIGITKTGKEKKHQQYAHNATTDPLPSHRIPCSFQSLPLVHQQEYFVDDCEFHCGSLHGEGRSIQGAEGQNRNVSPKALNGTASVKSSHVRFQPDQQPCGRDSLVASGVNDCRDATPNKVNSATKKGTRQQKSPDARLQDDSSESEMELEALNAVEEEFESDGSGVTTEKFLMLTDQLSSDQRKHLTILDLGVILERLKAKIIDVERLEREREGPGCFRWMIKATIRGEVLRDLGVLYNGNYYSISEDPDLQLHAASGFDDEEDRGDQV